MNNETEDAQAKIEAATKRWQQSEKGKASFKKYRNTPSGREANLRYLQSEKGRAALLKYYLSPKGTKTRQRRKELNRLFTQCKNFLEKNPNETIDDFLSQLQKEAPNE